MAYKPICVSPNPSYAPQAFLSTTHELQTHLRIIKSYLTLHKAFCRSHTTHNPICVSPNLNQRSTSISIDHTRPTIPFVHHQAPFRAPQTFLPITHDPQIHLCITKTHYALHKLSCPPHTLHKTLCASPNSTPRSTNPFVNHTRSTNTFAYHQTPPHAPQALLSITRNPQITLHIVKLISRFTKFSYLRRYSRVLRKLAQSPADLCRAV